MTPLTFSLALLALMLSPGPTNTLLALGGATLGLRRAMPLIAVALAGYMVVVAPLLLIGGPFLKSHPLIALLVTFASAGWVFYLAANLWGRGEGSAATQFVTPSKVLVTTLLNPKALVIGLVLLPSAGFTSILPAVAVLAGIVSICSAVWIGAGAAIGIATSQGLPLLLRRGAALYLAVVAVGLVLNSLRTIA
jgi:threonine/homoserine/homoserine lactone efflux protein